MPTWTTLPQAFKNAGYTVLGAGKYFHDGDGGLGFFRDGQEVYPGGTGAPPQMDPVSWTPGVQQFPNIQDEYTRFGNFQNSFDGCASTGGEATRPLKYRMTEQPTRPTNKSNQIR